MNFRNIFAFAMICAPAVGVAEAKDVPIVTHASSSNLESAQSFEFVSRFNDESYRISVYVPKGPVPEAGFPTLYVLDGGNLFGTFVNAISNESKNNEAEPAVVVGIEGGSGDKSANRSFDFTPSDLSDYEKNITVDLGANPKLGGYENFLRVIREEIKPKIKEFGKVDPNRDMIFGWSLGGQFVVRTMLTHPEEFSTYIAISSSLWYANKSVFAEIPAFEQKVASKNLQLSFWVGAGSLEQERSPGMMRWPLDQDKFAKQIKYDNIVGNTLDFSARLRPFFKERGMRFSSSIFAGETHNTVPWSAINPILRFALPEGQIQQNTPIR